MAQYDFLEGGGEMGELMRTINWAATPVGDTHTWPLCLQLSVRNMLHNKIGQYIAWGPEYTQMYNDAYRPILGSTKHPAAMGISTRETFAEIWDIIGPMFGDVMKGASIGFPDFMLPLNRHGFIEECYFDFSYSPIFNEVGAVAGVLVTVIETTEKAKYLKQIQEDEERFEFAIDAAELGTWDLDPVSKTFVANAKARSWFGFEPSGAIDFKDHLECIIDEDRDRVIDEMNKSLDTSSGGIYNTEYSIIHPKTNEKRKVRAKGRTTFNEQGSAIRSTGIIEDITEEDAAKMELLKSQQIINESERNLRSLVMNAPVAMCVLKGKNYIVEIANHPVLELWGTTIEGVLGKPIFEGLPEVKGQGLETLLDEVYQTGNTFHATEHPVNLRRNGILKTVYLNFIYAPFKEIDGEITGIISVAIDVTEQVETRLKIEEAEERARLAVEGANIGTYDIDLLTDTVISSERFNRIFGLEEGNSRHELVSRYHPEDLHIRNAAYQEALDTGHSTYQVRLLLKDGTLKWVRCDGTVFYDHNKKPVRLLGTVLDVTAIIDIQRQKDDFLAIASHELKTPLTSIKAYTQILSPLVKAGDQITAVNIIKKTERQVDKMIRLIHNFLDITKLESSRLQLEKEPFDLNDLVREIINYYNIPENRARLRFDSGDINTVNADKLKIGHVIDNLISNALKYSPPDTIVTVHTYENENGIVLSVKDIGKGINEDSKEGIFRRFYRAENVKRGTASGFGIGLYFSAEVIKLHEGRIWFDSKEGEGSTFYFSLPVQD